MKVQPYFDVLLPYPPSLNTAWRCVGGRVVLAARQRGFRTVVREIVGALLSNPDCVYSKIGRLPFVADITIYPPTRRAYDLDNLPKSILDALMHAGVFADDSQVVELVLRKGDIMPRPGACWVTLTATSREIPGETPEKDRVRRMP